MELQARVFTYTIHEGDAASTVVGLIQRRGDHFVAFSYEGHEREHHRLLRSASDPAMAAYFDTPDEALEAVRQHRANLAEA